MKHSELGILEVRRFSNSNDTLDTKMQAGGLNLSSLMNYLSLSLRDQLRFLMLSIKRYIGNYADNKELVDNLDNYLASELARLFARSKAELKISGGTLNSILGLNKYGTEITKYGQLLTRSLIKANTQQTNTGFINSKLQEEIQINFGALVDAFRREYIDGVINRGDMTLEDAAVTSQTRTHADLDLTDDKLVIKYLGNFDIDEVLPEIRSCYSGSLNIEVDQELNTYSIDFHDSISENQKLDINKKLNKFN